MKKIILVFFLLIFSFPSFAADKKEPELVIPKEECEYLTTVYHEPAGVEYQPGVDIHGKPVMGADITPSVIKPPEKYSFDITVDVAKYMGMTTPTGVMGEAKIGTVTVEKGQIKFNGRPLEGEAEAALKELCSKQTAKKAKKLK